MMRERKLQRRHIGIKVGASVRMHGSENGRKDSDVRKRGGGSRETLKPSILRPPILMRTWGIEYVDQQGLVARIWQ